MNLGGKLPFTLANAKKRKHKFFLLADPTLALGHRRRRIGINDANITQHAQRRLKVTLVALRFGKLGTQALNTSIKVRKAGADIFGNPRHS